MSGRANTRITEIRVEATSGAALDAAALEALGLACRWGEVVVVTHNVTEVRLDPMEIIREQIRRLEAK